MRAALVVALVALAAPAYAGDFDADGRYRPDPRAVAALDFSAFDAKSDYFSPPENPAACLSPVIQRVPASDALTGDAVLHVHVQASKGCAARFLLHGIPKKKASYRATLWTRHGGLDAQLDARYAAKPAAFAKMAPTGRTTSDGWVELATNELPVDGAALAALYVKVYDFDAGGADVDALELVESGAYVEPPACVGAGDPICGPEAVCLFGQCQLGRLYVGPLPDAAVRDQVVDRMSALLALFFGGRKTRLEDLPGALARIEALRSATSPWQFWNGWADAIRHLHDWHTHANGAIQTLGGGRRLNACFIAGVGDASAAIWPRDPRFDDVLVSHTGASGTGGMGQGDRLVAIDGQHPIAWALGLKDVDWGWWQAVDDRVVSEMLERMRDSILAYASELTFIACDKPTGSCDPLPRTVKVADLDYGPNAIACDNRPYYYYESGNPGADHAVGYKFYSGRVAGTAPDEKIFGLTWDTLYGGGDPNGFVNASLASAYAGFKKGARGVILDHRAGNGGTIDGAETATRLMAPPATKLAFRSPIDVAGSDGPADASQGQALFDAWSGVSGFEVGAADYDPQLPVALLLHRDGSASDFFPYGVKGAPKVRIFAPAPTAGGFSTFYVLLPWGPVSFQFASGDSISSAGAPLIGHGVEPDEVVKQRQSDILAGKDSMVEAALAWLRTGLKP